jgi:hypothetical protein
VSFHFLNFLWDDQKNDLTYTQDQVVPLPMGMRSYETISFLSRSLGTDLFLNHQKIPISDQPCFVGACIAAYEKAICIRQHIILNRDSLSHEYNIDLNRNVLPKYEAYTRQPLAMAFFKTVFEFQQAAVGDGNKTRDDITLSYNMGFVGVREDSSDGAAAVILDMLLKFGVLVYNQDKAWALHRFCETSLDVLLWK